MKGKLAAVLAVILCLSMPAGAKDTDKGVETKMDQWGIVTVPTDLIMEEGIQPYLTAQAYGNDVVRMLEEVYPVRPECWQLVQMDDGQFQYGCLLRYSVDVWQAEAAVGGRQQENSYLRDIGSRPDLSSLAARADNRLRTSLPANFELVQPFTAVKVRGRTFYECQVQRILFLNQSQFTETIYTLAWQHGDQIEMAVVLGHMEKDDMLPADKHTKKAKEGSPKIGTDLITNVADMLKNAQKMPRK